MSIPPKDDLAPYIYSKVSEIYRRAHSALPRALEYAVRKSAGKLTLDHNGTVAKTVYFDRDYDALSITVDGREFWSDGDCMIAAITCVALGRIVRVCDVHCWWSCPADGRGCVMNAAFSNLGESYATCAHMTKP